MIQEIMIPDTHYTATHYSNILHLSLKSEQHAGLLKNI